MRCSSRLPSVLRPIPDWGTVPFEGIEGTVGASQTLAGEWVPITTYSPIVLH